MTWKDHSSGAVTDDGKVRISVVVLMGRISRGRWLIDVKLRISWCNLCLSIWGDGVY